jgi:hypothetical protein
MPGRDRPAAAQVPLPAAQPPQLLENIVQHYHLITLSRQFLYRNTLDKSLQLAAMVGVKCRPVAHQDMG